MNDQSKHVSKAEHTSNQNCRGTNVGMHERYFSAAAGGVLLFCGLFRHRLPSISLTALGAGLLHRAFTGHCGAYEKLGINTADHRPTGSLATSVDS